MKIDIVEEAIEKNEKTIIKTIKYKQFRARIVLRLDQISAYLQFYESIVNYQDWADFFQFIMKLQEMIE